MSRVKSNASTRRLSGVARDLEKILTRFRELNVQPGESGPNPRNFALELTARDLAMSNVIMGIVPKGNDQEMVRWQRKIWKAMREGHRAWMELPLSGNEMLIPRKKPGKIAGR